MSSRFLLSVFDFMYLIGLTAWLGSILFYSFCMAPLIFRVLDAEAGAKFVRALFPRFYAWGAIAGALSLPSFVAVPLIYPEYRGPMIGVQAMAILGGTLAMLYAGNSLTPAINSARDAGPREHRRFERLHRRSVRLNAAVLTIGLGLLFCHANRASPKSLGIVEMTPQERARFDAGIDRAIESVESKYGLRPRRADEVHSGDSIDPKVIEEIETFYKAKAHKSGRPVAANPVTPGQSAIPALRSEKNPAP